MSLNWKDVQVGDVVKIHYVRKPDTMYPSGRDEYFYSSVNKVNRYEVTLSDIACTDETELEQDYTIDWKQLTGEFVRCSSFYHKFVLLEMVSFSDKLKQEYPECYI